MPKCYAFDTGFVTFAKGWERIREDDRGYLWEHLVLDSLRARLPDRELYYWRDKSGREVDFVYPERDRQVNAIECKINPDRFESGNLAAFRALYPKGSNYVVSPAVKTPYQRQSKGLVLNYRAISPLQD